MTSIERTAYPQFRRLTSARVWHGLPVRRCLGLDPETAPDHGAARTAKWHRRQVRVCQGVTYDQRRARALAAAEIRSAALVKNHPPGPGSGAGAPGQPAALHRAAWRCQRPGQAGQLSGLVRAGGGGPDCHHGTSARTPQGRRAR
jgi:hypothetical protein